MPVPSANLLVKLLPEQRAWRKVRLVASPTPKAFRLAPVFKISGLANDSGAFLP
ncbi:MAG: hypothetical protein WBN75_18820 [Verrucomicrobiia bacterium]